jgi:hypothetical protein
MQPLSAEGILRVWETGRNQHPVDRALTLLLAAEPGESRATLAALSIAERDARLLDLRARTLGPVLAVFARCRACGEHLEFAAHVDELAATAAEAGAWELEADGRTFLFRLPDSHDLAAAAQCGDPRAARRLLAERCVLSATGARDADGADALSERAVAALAVGMARAAPRVETLFDLSCPACGERWQEALDLAAFLWKEVAAQATRILDEVDALARVYHWSEAEILAMSPTRRHAYLDLAWR